MIVTVQTVPFGALTYPAPEPSFTLMWHVRTWFVPTGFSAFAGVIEMFASTQFLDAFPLPPGPGFVAVVRGITTPLTGMFDVA